MSHDEWGAYSWNRSAYAIGRLRNRGAYAIGALIGTGRLRNKGSYWKAAGAHYPYWAPEGGGYWNRGAALINKTQGGAMHLLERGRFNIGRRALRYASGCRFHAVQNTFSDRR